MPYPGKCCFTVLTPQQPPPLDGNTTPRSRRAAISVLPPGHGLDILSSDLTPQTRHPSDILYSADRGDGQIPQFNMNAAERRMGVSPPVWQQV